MLLPEVRPKVAEYLLSKAHYVKIALNLDGPSDEVDHISKLMVQHAQCSSYYTNRMKLVPRSQHTTLKSYKFNLFAISSGRVHSNSHQRCQTEAKSESTKRTEYRFSTEFHVSIIVKGKLKKNVGSVIEIYKLYS